MGNSVCRCVGEGGRQVQVGSVCGAGTSPTMSATQQNEPVLQTAGKGVRFQPPSCLYMGSNAGSGSSTW